MNEFGSVFLSNAVVPILIVVVGAITGIISYFGNKISKSIIAKNELSEMDKKNNIRNEIIVTISKNVDAAVGANMQLANKMKEKGHQLTQEEANALHNSAKQLIMNALPVSLTTPDGVLSEIIGGQEKLNSIIDILMEKSVYEYKLKKIQSEPSVTNNEEIPYTPATAPFTPTASMRPPSTARYNSKPKTRPIKK